MCIKHRSTALSSLEENRHGSPPPAPFQLLQRLPEELRLAILSHLSKRDHVSLSLACRECYGFAAPLIWRHVELVDGEKGYDSEFLGPSEMDEHDDTPIIKKLIVLAENPRLGSYVRSLTHRCHLPTPAIFSELPTLPFCSQTLSADPRTIKLVQLAAQNLTNLQTLRIIMGHPNLTDAILRSLFDVQRPRHKPITRLWLENCRFNAGCSLTVIDRSNPYRLPTQLDFGGLCSVRFRRLPMRPASTLSSIVAQSHLHGAYSRGGTFMTLSNGQATTYRTSMNPLIREMVAGRDHLEALKQYREHPITFDHQTWPLMWLFGAGNWFDDAIYNDIATKVVLPRPVIDAHVPSHCQRSVLAYRGDWLDPPQSLSCVSPEVLSDPNLNHVDRAAYGGLGTETLPNRETQPTADVALALIHSCSSTLRSLCFDWVFTEPQMPSSPRRDTLWRSVYARLFQLRFPQLRAFQLRNAVAPDGLLPGGVFLLDSLVGSSQGPYPGAGADVSSANIAFMEYHDKLSCLGWPMDLFYSANGLDSEIRRRVDHITDNLSETLEDLRVDTNYVRHGEQKTEEFVCTDKDARSRRRLFISMFAARMKKLKSVKLEGGIPRDERREVVRALHACPLEKIVMIGVNWPLGNTWGLSGQDLEDTYTADVLGTLAVEHNLEEEDKDEIFELGLEKPITPGDSFQFRPSYGWPPSAPMVHAIASMHSRTVKQLKFCGFYGSPNLLCPTRVTKPMLLALREFHNLESFVFSMLLDTTFNAESRELDIIDYWLGPRSTASPPVLRFAGEGPTEWENELLTKYAPKALAGRVTEFIGQYLSEEAKAREGGVHVRASFCIGDGGLFDLDCNVGKTSLGMDVCLGYVGPREEAEAGRRKDKLNSRRWF